MLAGKRAGTVPGAGSLRWLFWLMPDAALSDCALVFAVAPAGGLALAAALGGFAAANAARRAAADAANCAADAADNGALAANRGVEAVDVPLEVAADAAPPTADAASIAPPAAALALEVAADAVKAGVEAMIVSEPGPVSGTGTGRVATELALSLDPVLEPPPSHKPKPISPTQTTPANSQRFCRRFGVDTSDPGWAVLDGSPGTDSPRPENSGSGKASNSTRSRSCATLGCGMRMVRSGSMDMSLVGVRSAVLVTGFFHSAVATSAVAGKPDAAISGEKTEKLSAQANA